MSVRIVVVGGGITGLAAAYALRRQCPQGTRITVVDGAPILGGKLRVSRFAGRPVDEGAESFLARVPEAVDLARAVGCGGDLVSPATTAASVAVAGRCVPLPTGTVLGVPGDLDALARTSVLSAGSLARVRAESAGVIEAVGEDIAVGTLVRRRLGDEVVDRLVDPLLGGVYAGRADSLSLRATMPALAAALRTPRSLTEAAAAVLRSATGAGQPVFATLRRGAGSLVDAVAAALDGEVLLGLPVREIQRTRAGFRLTLGPAPEPTYLEADAVVLAVPARPAARILAAVAPSAAAELAGIEYASMAVVTLGYPAAVLPAGSGLLVAATEGRSVKAVTFSSQKWQHLGGDLVLVRASIGRHGEEAVLQCDDAELAALAGSDIEALTGLGSRPVESRVSRWGGALPQYAVGHLDRVRRIRAGLSGLAGLAVAGAAYDGVGVPACIRSGYVAAAQVAAHLRESADG
ncbi:MAG: protoporphyrinogen oxidase [Actinomycetota bacterium]|nr:protoporphyrinogen oxidase [Actinomycetota bacterium]